ncbi:DUF4034 domain-containing protein [Rhodoferax sp. AJA081-3]|uniref:DUF4034 domain-containing protein n=1 Tax=Rhodoferax sp. AJA081-3 TaxID=2752316 RepID=UPI001ADF7038|nr:DUF4034 domain-containing protein [Rhodoferax sp. AJA081-3]QTN29076.1 DUF4034 domain-containing protein [Rhodoferax sp. AJA081-3]
MTRTKPRIFLNFVLVLSLFFLAEKSSYAVENIGAPLALLKQRQLGDLDRLMNGYLDGYKRDTDKEFDAANAFDTLSVRDLNISHLFDEWIMAFPKSAAARLAKGRYNYEMAWLSRGGGYISEVPQDKISGMESYISRSIEDLRRACELDPSQALFSRYLIQAYMTLGQREDLYREYKRAITLDQHVRGARYAYLFALLPQWGGSYQEMEGFLSELKGIPDTPKTIKTKGDLEQVYYLQRSQQSFREADFEQALKFANQAVAANRSQPALSQVGYVLVKLNRHSEAISIFTEAIDLSPATANELRGPRQSRAFAYRTLLQNKEALDDYAILAERGNAYAQYFLGYAYVKGWGGIKQNQPEGIKWLSLAADRGNESARKLILEIKSNEIR